MIPFFRENVLINDDVTLKDFYSNCGNEDIRNSLAEYVRNKFSYTNFFLTKSCTQALEIAIMTLGLPTGSEVILPSYGFVSVANAVVINGLKCVFVDCDPDTMNVSILAIENAITEKTGAVISINYSGVACDYDRLREVCTENNIYLIEDNAHGIHAKYKDRFLGNFGDISTISFDFYKNISCGEGGGMTINNPILLEKFKKVYHFGTNKSDFLEGNVTAYEWKSIGTNALLAKPLALILKMQLENSDLTIQTLKSKWQYYFDALSSLVEEGFIRLLKVPDFAEHNAHMFWIKVNSEQERINLIEHLKAYDIIATFHYKPLHTSEFGYKVGKFVGNDNYTTSESSKLIRIPFYYDLTKDEQSKVIDCIQSFYKSQIS